MKTLFITIFEGVEVKNILRTPILKYLLADQQVRIVLFTKSVHKVEYYRREFNDPRLVYEVVEWKQTSWIDGIFSKLKFTLLRTSTTNLKRKMVAQLEGAMVNYYIGRIVNFALAWSCVRRCVRVLDRLLVNDRTYSRYFDQYAPDLVLLAHLFDEPEIALLREAKRRGVLSIGLINTWDKITSRCMMRLLPDKAIVFNDIVKEELMRFNEMKPTDIFVSGLPQYDQYRSHTPCPRAEFFKKIGLSPHNKLIVYAPMGRSFSGSDWDIVDLLDDLITSGSLPHTELLIRFQPNDFVDDKEVAKRPHLAYDYPGIRFGSKRGVDWDMNQADLDHLSDTLFHMSVIVCYASSISIDAAYFDKPIINIGFELHPPRFLIQSPTQYYQSLHYRNALNTGAIDLVSTREELVQSLTVYLNDPRRKIAERARLVSEQCVYTDGASGRRIAEYILNFLL